MAKCLCLHFVKHNYESLPGLHLYLLTHRLHFFSLVDLLSLFQSFNCDSERPHTEMVLIKSGEHNLTTYSYQMVLGCFTAQQEKGPPFFQFFQRAC